ncbi:MAG: hypothetical protein ABIR96_03855 [Bdellovibrionota bacterium]
MKLPGSITKRDILFGTRRASAAEILTLGKAYASEGHLSDAIDFFSKAQSTTELEGLVSQVISEGDMFLLLKISRLLGDDRVSHSHLEQCVAKAQSLGKIRYAIMGLEKLGQKDQAEALRETIAQDGDIIAFRESETFISPNLEEIQATEED